MSELIKHQSVGTFGATGGDVLEDIIATVLDITVKAWPFVVSRESRTRQP